MTVYNHVDTATPYFTKAQAAEARCLASILIDPSVLDDVQHILSGPADFFKGSNQLIFNNMLEIYRETGTVDLVQLEQQLTNCNALTYVGGMDYIVELAGAVPSAARATSYARIIKQNSIFRQLIVAANQILNEEYKMTGDPTQMLEVISERVYAAMNVLEPGGFRVDEEQ